MTISFARHQFPPAIIRHAVWLYVRFTLSYRDVEDLLAERGLDVSYETVRRWVFRLDYIRRFTTAIITFGRIHCRRAFGRVRFQTGSRLFEPRRRERYRRHRS